MKISIQKTDVREIVNCLHILGNEPYFQLLLFIISDLRKAHVRLEQVGKMKNVRLEQLFVRLEQVGLG